MINLSKRKAKDLNQTAETVLVLAPSFNDSAIAVNVLNEAGISGHPCRTMHELFECLKQTYGAVVVSEEAFGPMDVEWLQRHLDRQEPWSDIPIILMTQNNIARAVELFTKSGNISLLERPFARLTLIRSVEVALRARRKQFEVRQLLADLNKAKQDAENANNSKTQFLANMSHEIRTPIGAILGFTDLMRNPTNSQEENFNYMGIVERNSHQLLRLIDDILDLSKVEAGKLTFENIGFSLVEMLVEFNSIMSFKAKEKGIDFKLTNSTALPEQINTDPVRLKQILTNVVGNALKFTHKGLVSLDVSFKVDQLFFSVTDTGIGISKDQEKNLFQPFAQADTSTTRRFGGTGLGLVLARSLAESLGGHLTLASSVEGQGSTFVFNVKISKALNTKMIYLETIKTPNHRSKRKTTKQMLKGLNILLVEDSPDNQMLIATYLEKEGAQVECAGDGAEGYRRALAEPFDLLLMDIQMPIMDGHETTSRLRSAKYNKPLIALTAHAMKEEQLRCYKSGFTEFLTKPVQRDLLVRVLSRYMPTANV